LEHQVDLPSLLAVVVDRDDIGVAAEARGHARFTLESLDVLGAADDVRSKELDGNVTFERGLIRFVDRGKAAAAQLRDDAVGALMAEGFRHTHKSSWWSARNLEPSLSPCGRRASAKPPASSATTS